MPNWLFWALISSIFAALTAIFAKIGLQQVNSHVATWVRTVVILVAISFLLSYARLWSHLGQLSAKNLLFLILSGLATGLSWLAYFKALQQGAATQVAPIDKLSLVWVTVLAVLFLGERPSMQEWLGISLIFIGVLILSLKF